MVKFRITFNNADWISPNDAKSVVIGFLLAQEKLEETDVVVHNLDKEPIEVDLTLVDATDSDEKSAYDILREDLWGESEMIHNISKITP